MSSVPWRALHAPAATVVNARLPWPLAAPVPAEESDPLASLSMSAHADESLELYYALCAFTESLGLLIPTAVSVEAHSSDVEEWATGVRVTVHGSDFEDVRILAHSFGVGGHVSVSIDASLSPSACSSGFSDAYYAAEHELTRVLSIGDSSRCEIMSVEAGSTARLRGAGTGCVTAAAAPFEPAGSTGAGELGGAALPRTESPAELWLGVPRASLARMQRKVAMLASLLPNAPVRVFELSEEPLIKHLPSDDGFGRLRFDASTVMAADGAGHPSTSIARVEGVSIRGARYAKDESVADTALRPPLQIAPGGTRSCSMGAAVQSGEGAASTVSILGSAHGLNLPEIGSVRLEDTATADAATAAREGVELTALACVNPGRCAADPATPFGDFVKSCRAEPAAAPDTPEPLQYPAQVFSIAADIALYSLPSGPDDPPHGAADMELLPHLGCALPVSGMTQPTPCLPPFAAYRGIVLVTGINVIAGPGMRKLRVIGYAVKTLRVPIPAPGLRPSWRTVLVVTYFAAPASGIAPFEGDSGGGVYQLSAADGSFVLHSFVSARAVLTDPTTGEVLGEFYTLTPAHLALEQVRALQASPGSALPQGALKFVHPIPVRLR